MAHSTRSAVHICFLLHSVSFLLAAPEQKDPSCYQLWIGMHLSQMESVAFQSFAPRREVLPSFTLCLLSMFGYWFSAFLQLARGISGAELKQIYFLHTQLICRIYPKDVWNW